MSLYMQICSVVNLDQLTCAIGPSPYGPKRDEEEVLRLERERERDNGVNEELELSWLFNSQGET